MRGRRHQEITAKLRKKSTLKNCQNIPIWVTRAIYLNLSGSSSTGSRHHPNHVPQSLSHGDLLEVLAAFYSTATYDRLRRYLTTFSIRFTPLYPLRQCPHILHTSTDSCILLVFTLHPHVLRCTESSLQDIHIFCTPTPLE